MCALEREARPVGSDNARVLFITDRLEPRLGMERALLDLVEKLGQRLKVHVVVLAGPLPTSNFRGEALGADNGTRGRLSSLRSLRHAIARERFDVVVAVGLWAYVTAAFATVWSPVRIVLWEHSLLPWRLRHESSVLAGAIGLRLLAHKLRAVISVSPCAAKTSRALCWPFATPVIIPNLLPDPSSVRNDKLKSSRILVGIGSLTRRKNWRLAIDALSRLDDGTELIVAGEGPERPRLERQVRRLGLEHRVQLLGHVADVDSLLSQADVVVHPSQAETLGYALVEAAAMHRPVVALRRPVMSSLVPTYVCGVTTNPKSTAFASGIQQALDTPFSFTDADAKRAAAFSDEVILQLWEDFVSEHAR